MCQKVVFIFQLWLLFVVSGDSQNPKDYNSNLDDIHFQLSNAVKNYYYLYFEFPEKTDKLYNYMWERLNAINEYTYDSYENLKKANKNCFEKELINTIDYLLKYKDKVTIEIQGEKFVMDFNNIDNMVIEFEADFCRDKNIHSSEIYKGSFSFFYDKNYILTRHDYSYDFNEGLKKIRNQYIKPEMVILESDTIPRVALLRYEKGLGMISLCQDNVDFESEFLVDIENYVEAFISSNEEIYYINFLTYIMTR